MRTEQEVRDKLTRLHEAYYNDSAPWVERDIQLTYIQALEWVISS